MTDIFDAAYKAYDDNQPHSQGILAVVNVVLGIEQERFDAAWLKWRAEKDQLKHYHELLNRENEQFREALGMARTEYGGKNIEDLDEYDRLRLTANAFQAMNGVLELQVNRNKARVEELEAKAELLDKVHSVVMRVEDEYTFTREIVTLFIDQRLLSQQRYAEEDAAGEEQP